MAVKQAVIFDLDGCLVDSEPLALDALAAQMRECGVEDAESRLIRDNFLGVSISVICDYIAERTGRPCPADFVPRFEDRVIAIYEDRLNRIDGAMRLIDRLEADGVALAIGTGGSLRRMGETLRISDLAPRFGDHAYSADQVERGKPAPDLVLFAAAALGVAPGDCVVVEDSPHGIKGAVAAGMCAVGFNGGSHLEGIRDSHAARLAEAGALTVVGDLDAVYDAIRRCFAGEEPSGSARAARRGGASS